MEAGRRNIGRSGDTGPGASLLGGLLDLVCPPMCLICGALIRWPDRIDPVLTANLCSDCRADLPTLPNDHCRFCGLPFKTDWGAGHVCGTCRRKRPPFDQALAVGLYEGGLRKAIHLFKYSGRTELAGPLAAFMALGLTRPYYPPEVDLVLPVPLHRHRLKERGFNQSLLLSRALFSPWKHKVRHDLLVRHRPTDPQVSLEKKSRRRNVRRAFSLIQPDSVRKLSVMLVDDVFTTGSTVMECTRVLKRAGAGRVLVLTLARAV